jgi:hypothetical protein
MSYETGGYLEQVDVEVVATLATIQLCHEVGFEQIQFVVVV